jgi:hypothetical protein
MVQADFQGLTGTLAVALKPRLPAVSVKALVPAVLENGTGASFRIFRSSALEPTADGELPSERRRPATRSAAQMTLRR